MEIISVYNSPKRIQLYLSFALERMVRFYFSLAQPKLTKRGGAQITQKFLHGGGSLTKKLVESPLQYSAPPMRGCD